MEQTTNPLREQRKNNGQMYLVSLSSDMRTGTITVFGVDYKVRHPKKKLVTAYYADAVRVRDIINTQDKEITDEDNKRLDDIMEHEEVTDYLMSDAFPDLDLDELRDEYDLLQLALFAFIGQSKKKLRTEVKKLASKQRDS